MPNKHSLVTKYANSLLDAPRAHLVLELPQNKHGLLLTHQTKGVVECYLTPQGMATGAYMAKALGVRLPALGATVKARVSTGVVFRAISIASLDVDEEAALILLERLLEEAEMQRGGVSELS